MSNLLLFLRQHYFISTLALITLILIIIYEAYNKRSQTPAIEAHDAIQLMNHHDAIIIDVREATLFKQGHIINAINIPTAQLLTKPTLLDQYQNKTLIMVDKTNLLSTKLIQQIKPMKNIKILQGGIEEWRTLNLPLIKN